MKVILGQNDFFGVPFPLVLADRFFHIYPDQGGLNLDVFRWDEETSQPVYEVLAGQPQEQNISTNPTGIVTFGHPDTETFLYKFRPKPGISQIFGKIPVEKEFEVCITDHDIRVVDVTDVDDPRDMVTLERNQFSGMDIGIQVGADGSIGIGVSGLPPGMVLERRSA